MFGESACAIQFVCRENHLMKLPSGVLSVICGPSLPPSLLLLYDHKLLASTFKEGGGGGQGGGGNGLIFRTRREEEHLQKIGRGRILAPSFNLVWLANLNSSSVFFHKYNTFWECFESRILPLQHPSTPAAEELGWLR